MVLTGCLAELSLPEIFWLLEQGRQTGLLTLSTGQKLDTDKEKFYYIWLHQGRIVAASNNLECQGLLSEIAQKGWASKEVADQICQLCPSNTPIGDYLRVEGVLNSLQLQKLFAQQVKQPVYALFKLPNASFKFEPTAALPWSEMTGLSISTVEVTLQGLRALTDWSHLKHKFSDLNSALLTSRSKPSYLQFEALEWRVWEFADGTVDLEAIARALRLPSQKVQQIAFRLRVVGLAKEVEQDIVTRKPQPAEKQTLRSKESAENPKYGSAFVQNLISIRRQQA